MEVYKEGMISGERDINLVVIYNLVNLLVCVIHNEGTGCILL